MLEAIVHLSRAPAAVYLADPNAALPEAASRGDRSTETAAATARQEQILITQLIEDLNDIVAELRQQRQGLLQEMQQVAIELATAVASQAIYNKIQAGDFPIESLVQAAVQRLGSAGPVVVRLHPDDLALLNRRMEGGRRPLDGEVRLEADATLKRGDCRADAGELGVWCKMQAQIEEMRECMLESLGNAEVERRKNSGSDSALRRFPDRRQTA